MIGVYEHPQAPATTETTERDNTIIGNGLKVDITTQTRTGIVGIIRDCTAGEMYNNPPYVYWCSNTIGNVQNETNNVYLTQGYYDDNIFVWTATGPSGIYVYGNLVSTRISQIDVIDNTINYTIESNWSFVIDYNMFVNISCPGNCDLSFTPAGKTTIIPDCDYYPDSETLICYDLPVEVSNETDMNVLTITQVSISCGNTITSDTTLTADITGCTGHGIIIGADNIVLDCAGHTIAGMDVYNTYGVKNIDSGYANVTVKNCIVRDFEHGIYFGGHGNIINNTVVSNTDSGIRLYQSSNNQITNSVASNNGYGIMLFYSSNNRIINCNLTDNDWDLAVKPLSDEDCNNKLDNVIGSNNLPIKYFNSSTTLSNEILSGIILCNADYSNITNITINASQTKKNNVFYVARTDYSNFTQITSSENWMGLFFFYSSNNQVKDSIFNNNIVGILVGIYSSNNIIYNNLFNNTNNFQMLDVETNQWNTSRQAGKRIYSPGTEIGGNYWTSPSGNGYSDTCIDSDKDGFCDEAYTLAENNTDYLPLSKGITSPNITILSPQNTTYFTVYVPLKFSVNKPTSWCGYSLDGTANKTLVGCANTTLTLPSYSTHNIIVYANDTSKNMGKSSKVYFTTKTSGGGGCPPVCHMID